LTIGLQGIQIFHFSWSPLVRCWIFPLAKV